MVPEPSDFAWHIVPEERLTRHERIIEWFTGWTRFERWTVDLVGAPYRERCWLRDIERAKARR